MIAIQQNIINKKAKALKLATKIVGLRFIALPMKIEESETNFKNNLKEVWKYENEKDIFAPRLKKRIVLRKDFTF